MNSGTDLFVGVDVGTSGVRAIAIDADQNVMANTSCRMDVNGDDHRDPALWKAALATTLSSLLQTVSAEAIRAISVDGTSGTMLPVNGDGAPLDTPMMYNDPVTDTAIIDRISAIAPETSAALGANSALARAIVLQDVPGTVRVIHQADWIAGLLSGHFDVSDENNALKTGYDPVAGNWPSWIGDSGIREGFLPQIVEPGTATGKAIGALARELRLLEKTVVIAGTTDGCASFLATGADKPGEGVSALGTTLTVKLLSDKPVFAPQYGIYSHRLVGGWLAGGASNTGGNVLVKYFPADRIKTLSENIDPETDSGLDYYPLARPGERFPVNDAAMKPRLSPRPEDDSQFLKGMLEGIAEVECLAYRRLAELGAPKLTSIRSVGGGAANSVWKKIRTRKLGVPAADVVSPEAAFGAALLAMKGAGEMEAA